MEMTSDILLGSMIYIVLAFVWGSFALYKQKLVNPTASESRNMICYFSNVIGFPICLAIWVFKKLFWKNLPDNF